MKILDILTSPWAMQPEKYEEVVGIYRTHLRGEKIDLKAIEAAIGRPLANESKPYEVVDGVAILDVSGVLAKGMSMFMRVCGGTSTAYLQRDLQMALDDPTVKAIILNVDSPGGAVDGTQELAQAVFSARERKPIVSLADGTMASAAYWIGSAASEVFIVSDTTAVGSIGIITTHVDRSQAEAVSGVKTTPIYSGKYKATGHPYAPLSEEDKALIQSRLDHIYTVFVESIAQFRGVSVDTVLSQMAEGQVFLGKQAIDAGLADGVSSLADLIARLSKDASLPNARAGAALPSNPSTQENAMPPITREQLQGESPDLLNALLQEGATNERARIQGCLDAALPGHEALVKTLAFDGKTTPGEAAQAVCAAERKVLASAGSDLQTGAPKPLPGAGDPGAAEAERARAEAESSKPKAESAQDFAARITAHMTAEAQRGRRITADQAATELQAKGKE